MKAGIFELGEPEHEVHCELCRGKKVGGPYFAADQAAQRLREHVNAIHGGSSIYVKWAQGWEPKRPPRKTIRMFGG